MEIKLEKENGKNIVRLKGRLDTVTSGDLEKEVASLQKEPDDGVILDFTELEYTSSAGLRVILMMHKRLTASGSSLVLRNVAAPIKSVLDMTGFSQFLNIE